MTPHEKPSEETVVESAQVRGFVQSKLFNNIFAEGMELVEETATYLDGEGREAAKDLSRSQALAYAAVSMRLTTRLMQIASWLLVLRAVRENEMSYAEAAEDKYRLGKPDTARRAEAEDEEASLPQRLHELRDETRLLYQRISRIDADIFATAQAPVSSGDAAGQLRSLQAAFSNGL
ncbi:DUF1465 family protein [Parvularcula sp. IMCC14364]|uniref:protease adaptor protein RcdA n=1 Tax=Parvularcula sp. IMCC14364 TaxID=3067902 RepID=UPI002740C473|nr:DUF1465 family protein [Parvularcula sp. IMCC14364]